MNFKMRTETHYYQPKKVRNTKCLDPMRIYFSARPISKCCHVPSIKLRRQGWGWT